MRAVFRVMPPFIACYKAMEMLKYGIGGALGGAFGGAWKNEIYREGVRLGVHF